MTRAHAERVREITADTEIPDQGTVKDVETTGWLQTEHKPQECGGGGDHSSREAKPFCII